MRRLPSTRLILSVATLLALLLIVAVGLAACGGADETTTTAASTPTTAPATTTAPTTAGTGSSETTATSAASGPATDTPYKIGILTVTSGDLGFLGKYVVDSMQLEVDKINADGGIDGHPIELVVQDDGYDQTKGAAGFTKLAEDPSILAITGTMATILLPSLTALAEQKEIPYVSCAPEIPLLRAQNLRWTFYGPADEFLNAAAILDIVKAKGFKSAVVISHNEPNALSVANEFVAEATAAGLQAVLLPDGVDIGTVDITPQANKLKALCDKQGADCVVSVVWPNVTGTLVKTMTGIGLSLPVVSYSLNADVSTLAMGGPELNGVMLPGPKVMAASWLPDSDPQKAIVVDFINRYKAKYNNLPGQVDAGAADCILWIAAALRASGDDRAKLRDALGAVKNLVGPLAIRTMGKEGDRTGIQPGLFVPMVIKDMQFAELKLQ
jgi:branched-chain amino acid transport system substrate-binding protein